VCEDHTRCEGYSKADTDPAFQSSQCIEEDRQVNNLNIMC